MCATQSSVNYLTNYCDNQSFSLGSRRGWLAFQVIEEKTGDAK